MSNVQKFFDDIFQGTQVNFRCMGRGFNKTIHGHYNKNAMEFIEQL